MRWLFWGSAGLIAYTYLGYPAWLWLRRGWSRLPVKRGPSQASVSVLMVVRNEEDVLPRKLQNLVDLSFPSDRLEIIVVSDGSTDGTNEILRRWAASHGIKPILCQQQRGKAACLNDAVDSVKGEIVLFTDARQIIEPEALRFLTENFADPQVGCASGELMLGNPESGQNSSGIGLYWRVEKMVRELESSSGSVVGATGALYAVRRSLIVPLPAETILDDVYIPLHVARQGSRVIFDARARAWDVPNLGSSREFARKVRTLSGNYQLVQLAPWLLTTSNPLRFEFVSHKLLRLAVPFALAGVLLSSIVARGPVYRATLAFQLAFYSLGLAAIAQPKRGLIGRVADAAFTFLVLNTAAAVAFANFVTGKKAAWIR